MSSKLYPEGSGGVHSVYEGGVLKFKNHAGVVIFSVDPAAQSVGGMGVQGTKEVTLSVSTATNTASSSADPTLVGGRILGWRPNSGGNSIYQIRSLVLNANGSVTVLMNANPTVASAVVVAIVALP